MSMAESKRDKTDVRDLIAGFLKVWQPAYESGRGNFAESLHSLLHSVRRQCLEDAKRCGCSSDEATRDELGEAYGSPGGN